MLKGSLEPLPAGSHTHTDWKEGHPLWQELQSDGALCPGCLEPRVTIFQHFVMLS